MTGRKRPSAALCLCLSALLLPAPWPGDALAQSGRKKPPPDASRGTGEQRPRVVKPSPPFETTAPLATPAPTATPAGAVVEDDEVVRINSNLVPLPASVVDAQGRAVTDLLLKDFELLVDGVARPLGDLSRAETPVRLAVLFDNSSSQRAGRDLELRAALGFFRNVLRPVDEAALYSITDSPELVQPLTNNVRELTRAVEHFPEPQGATSLFDAVAMAAEYLRPHAGRKVIVVISDGVDTTSELDFDTTLRRLFTADCQFYAVQTFQSDSANLRALDAERRLQEFAAQTGGAVYVPRANSDFDRAFSQIAADLAQQYVLSYYASGDERDGRFRTFTLRVPARPALRVRTRKGYYAPKG